MEVLQAFWDRLAGISRFEYASCPGPKSLTGWKGRASGTVEVGRDPSERWFHFHERCHFELEASGQGFDLKNQFRWSWAEGDCICLEQWRRGHPVHLVDLIEAGPLRLVQRERHLCGADDYALAILLRDNGFEATWTIRGPKKDEVLAYQYYSNRR